MPENLPKDVASTQKSAILFVAEVLVPLQGVIPSSSTIAKVREASLAAGFFQKTQPKEFGGQPASNLELAMLRELFAASNSPHRKYIFGPGPGVLHAVTGTLKQSHLAPLLRGEIRGAFAFTESDAAVRASWGRIDGDHVVINGHKSYVTGGASADFISALINVEHADGTKAGSAMIVIDRQTPGVSIDDEFESLDGSSHVSMTFNDVRIPLANLIGELGEGMPRALSNIGNVRMMVSAEATGMSMWAINYIEELLKAPHRSGTPLGEREGVRLRLADMRIEAYLARSALYRTARIVDSGDNCVNETAATKIFTSESAGRIVDMAVQLAGGQALVKGHPLEALYREVRSYRFVEGASDLLRLNLVKGKLELGLGRL